MSKTRLYYVDWLRVLTVLSLIPFHAALSYINFGRVYISSPISGPGAIPLMIIPSILSDFFMTLLFFLSGIASFYSFRSRKKALYIKERTRKLFLPLLFGTLFLCPVQAYMKAIYNGFKGNIIEFIPQFFSPKIVYYLGYCHFWFLLYLFVFSLAGVPLFNRLQQKQRIEKISAFLTKGNHMLLPILLIIVLEFFLRPFFHSAQTLIMDWANDAVYFSMFIFGYIYASSVDIQNRINRYFKAAAIIGASAFIVLFYIYYQWVAANKSPVYLTVLWAALKGFYECSAIIVLLCLGKKYLNKEGKPIKYLTKSSFTVYVFHFLPVTFFTLLLIRQNINIYIKYILVVVLSYACVFLIYEIISKLKLLKQKVF